MKLSMFGSFKDVACFSNGTYRVDNVSWKKDNEGNYHGYIVENHGNTFMKCIIPSRLEAEKDFEGNLWVEGELKTEIARGIGLINQYFLVHVIERM